MNKPESSGVRIAFEQFVYTIAGSYTEKLVSEGCTPKLMGASKTATSLGQVDAEQFQRVFAFRQMQVAAEGRDGEINRGGVFVVLSRWVQSEDLDFGHLYFRRHYLIVSDEAFRTVHNRFRVLVDDRLDKRIQGTLPDTTPERSRTFEIQPDGARLAELAPTFQYDQAKLVTLLHALFQARPVAITGYAVEDTVANERKRLDLLELLVLLLPEPLRPQLGFATRVFDSSEKMQRVVFAPSAVRGLPIDWAKEGFLTLDWSTGQVTPVGALPDTQGTYAAEIVSLLYPEALKQELTNLQEGMRRAGGQPAVLQQKAVEASLLKLESTGSGPVLVVESLGSVSQGVEGAALWTAEGLSILLSAWRRQTRGIFGPLRLEHGSDDLDYLIGVLREETLSPQLAALVLGRAFSERLVPGWTDKGWGTANNDLAKLVVSEMEKPEVAGFLCNAERGFLAGQPDIGPVWPMVRELLRRSEAGTVARRELLTAACRSTTKRSSLSGLARTVCRLPNSGTAEVTILIKNPDLAAVLPQTSRALHSLVGDSAEGIDGLALEKAFSDELEKDAVCLTRILAWAAERRLWDVIDEHSLCLPAQATSKEDVRMLFPSWLVVSGEKVVRQREPLAVAATSLSLARTLGSDPGSSEMHEALLKNAAETMPAVLRRTPEAWLEDEQVYHNLNEIFRYFSQRRPHDPECGGAWIPMLLGAAARWNKTDELIPAYAAWLNRIEAPAASHLVECIGQDGILSAREQCDALGQLQGLVHDRSLASHIRSLMIKALAIAAADHVRQGWDERHSSDCPGEFLTGNPPIREVMIDTRMRTVGGIAKRLQAPDRVAECLSRADRSIFAQSLAVQLGSAQPVETDAYLALLLVRPWLEIQELRGEQLLIQLVRRWLALLPGKVMRDYLEHAWRQHGSEEDWQPLLQEMLKVYTNHAAKAPEKAKFLVWWSFESLVPFGPAHVATILPAVRKYLPKTIDLLEYLSGKVDKPPEGSCIKAAYDEIQLGGWPRPLMLGRLIQSAVDHGRDRVFDTDALRDLLEWHPKLYAVCENACRASGTRSSEQCPTPVGNCREACEKALRTLVARRADPDRWAEPADTAMVAVLRLALRLSAWDSVPGALVAGLLSSQRLGKDYQELLSRAEKANQSAVRAALQRLVEDKRMASGNETWQLALCLELVRCLEQPESAQPARSYALAVLVAGQFPDFDGCSLEDLKRLIGAERPTDQVDKVSRLAYRMVLLHESRPLQGDQTAFGELEEKVRATFIEWLVGRRSTHLLEGLLDCWGPGFNRLLILKQVWAELGKQAGSPTAGRSLRDRVRSWSPMVSRGSQANPTKEPAEVSSFRESLREIWRRELDSLSVTAETLDRWRQILKPLIADLRLLSLSDAAFRPLLKGLLKNGQFSDIETERENFVRGVEQTHRKDKDIRARASKYYLQGFSLALHELVKEGESLDRIAKAFDPKSLGSMSGEYRHIQEVQREISTGQLLEDVKTQLAALSRAAKVLLPLKNAESVQITRLASKIQEDSNLWQTFLERYGELQELLDALGRIRQLLPEGTMKGHKK